MGVDINAVLYFGFPFLWEEDYDMDGELHDRLSAMMDEDDDSVPRPKEGTKDGEVAFGLSGDCYGDGTVHYVYIIGTEKQAGLWDAVDLSPAEMMTYDLLKWRQAIQEFCTANNIPWQEPGWKMTTERS